MLRWMVIAFSALSAGVLAYELDLPTRISSGRPRGDVLTQRLRESACYWLSRDFTWMILYRQCLEPLFQEVPLPDHLDLPLFLTIQVLCAGLLSGLAVILFSSAGLYLLPLTVVFGGLSPYLWLKHRQNLFHLALLKALPDCLESLALIMEAGLDLSAGIQHYLAKTQTNPLSGFLAGTLREMQLGRSRADAFSALGKRTSFAPLRDICRGIVQAISLGTSLAPFLRQQAGMLRLQRMHLAEKKAAEAPLKILFPLFVFIFPTIFIVLLGPIALMFAQGGF